MCLKLKNGQESSISESFLIRKRRRVWWYHFWRRSRRDVGRWRWIRRIKSNVWVWRRANEPVGIKRRGKCCGTDNSWIVKGRKLCKSSGIIWQWIELGRKGRVRRRIRRGLQRGKVAFSDQEFKERRIKNTINVRLRLRSLAKNNWKRFSRAEHDARRIPGGHGRDPTEAKAGTWESPSLSLGRWVWRRQRSDSGNQRWHVVPWDEIQLDVNLLPNDKLLHATQTWRERRINSPSHWPTLAFEASPRES